MHEEDDRELSREVAQAYGEVGPADPAAKARLMARLRREGDAPKPGVVAWDRREWMLEPYGSPAIAFGALALLVIGGLAGWTLRDRIAPPAAAPAVGAGIADAPSTRELRLVQFVLTAPKASRVTVVGDFNAWDPQATPMARRESGAWTAAIPVSPGRHVYAFIVDGDRWVADPAAPLAPEDGFGIRNSVIVVGGLEST